VVAWPWLAVRRWGDGSKHPPCRGGAQWLPGDLSRHGPFHKKEVLFCIQARKMQVLLPDLMEVLQKGNEHIKTKALVVTQNIKGRLKKREASSVAVQLAEKLLPLFDEVRLMGQPEPRRWALGKGSCPSAQPCEQRLEQPLLLCFLPWAPVGWLRVLQPSPASPWQLLPEP